MKENIPFFVNLNYFATGEGATDSCALVWAYTKKEALEKLLENYLHPTVVESIMKAEEWGALHEFSFHLYRNYS